MFEKMAKLFKSGAAPVMNKKISLAVMASLGLLNISNALAIETVFDKEGKLGIIEINNIGETYPECNDYKFDGKIVKAQRDSDQSVHSLDLYFRSRDGKITMAAPLSLKDLSMAELRALSPILDIGSNVRVHIQGCGSGNILYLISIKYNPLPSAKRITIEQRRKIIDDIRRKISEYGITMGELGYSQ